MVKIIFLNFIIHNCLDLFPPSLALDTAKAMTMRRATILGEIIRFKSLIMSQSKDLFCNMLMAEDDGWLSGTPTQGWTMDNSENIANNPLFNLQDDMVHDKAATMSPFSQWNTNKYFENNQTQYNKIISELCHERKILPITSFLRCL